MKKSEIRYKKRRLKEYRNLLMSEKFHDWDYTSILQVERIQMLRVARSLSVGPYKHTSWERDVYWIKLAVKILDMFLNDTWWTTDGGVIPYVNTKNSYRFLKYEPATGEDKKFLLYEEKLWHLYGKIRLTYMRGWWT